MNNSINGLLSCILITIPETTFMVLLLIKLCGRRKLLDIYRFKENIKWYMILIIPPSILMDLLNYSFKITPRGINTIVCLIFLYILTLYTFKKTDMEEVSHMELKVFLRIIPLYLILIMLDVGSAVIWFKYLNLTYIEISKNIYLVLLCSLPSRVIETVILIFILINKNSKLQMNLLNYVYRNNFFKRFSTISITLLLMFEIYVMKLIILDNLLQNLPLDQQIIFVIVFIYLTPSLIVTGFYLLIKCCVNIINDEKRENQIGD